MQAFNGLGRETTVVISAAASGIGKVMAKSFIDLGCNVCICDIDDQAIAQFQQEDGNVFVRKVNVASANEVQSFIAEVGDRFGCIDVLINNAGIAGPTAPVEDIDTELWDTTIDIDINSHFYFTKYCVPLMTRGGSIINISSNAAFSGFPLRSPYTAAKWALIGLTKTWAMELGVRNIRVNAVCPGSVNGPRIEGVIERDAKERNVSVGEIKKVYQRQSSMRLFVDAEDVTNAVLFLSSHLGKSISGQVLGVDGHTEGLSNWLDD